MRRTSPLLAPACRHIAALLCPTLCTCVCACGPVCFACAVADADAALTYPVRAGELKKGSYVVIQGHPCKVRKGCRAPRRRAGSPASVPAGSRPQPRLRGCGREGGLASKRPQRASAACGEGEGGSWEEGPLLGEAGGFDGDPPARNRVCTGCADLAPVCALTTGRGCGRAALRARGLNVRVQHVGKGRGAVSSGREEG
jgi:hypothetical protein